MTCERHGRPQSGFGVLFGGVLFAGVLLAGLTASCSSSSDEAGLVTTTTQTAVETTAPDEPSARSLVPDVALSDALDLVPRGFDRSWIEATSVAGLEGLLGPHPGGPSSEWVAQAERALVRFLGEIGEASRPGDPSPEHGWGFDGRTVAWLIAERNLVEVDSPTPWARVGEFDRDRIASTAANDAGWNDLLVVDAPNPEVDVYRWSDREMFLDRPRRDSWVAWGGGLIASDELVIRSFDDESAELQLAVLAGRATSVRDDEDFAGLLSALDAMGDELLTVTLVAEPLRLSELTLPDQFPRTAEGRATFLDVQLIRPPISTAFGIRVGPEGTPEPFVLLDHVSEDRAEGNERILAGNLTTGQALASGDALADEYPGATVAREGRVVTISFGELAEYHDIFISFDRGGSLLPVP